MEEINNILEPIQIMMDTVKKDILSKNDSQINPVHNKEIVNSLFNLLDYQITLMNQILLFNQNNKDMNDNGNNIDNLIRINKDILVSMINKFLSKLNSIHNKAKGNDENNYNINKRTKNSAKHGKLLSLEYSNNEKNKNYLLNSYAQYNSPIKKNMEKEFNSQVTLTQQSTGKKLLSCFFDHEKNSYKFIKNKNIMFSNKSKNMNKNIFDKLFTDDAKCDHEEKKKNKIALYQAYSKSMKDLFIDLNNNYKKPAKK